MTLANLITATSQRDFQLGRLSITITKSAITIMSNPQTTLKIAS
jgi:hypothetical protein